jgi:cysteine desulfurase
MLLFGIFGMAEWSACASEDLTPNPTFVALGVDPQLAHTGVRLSLSRFTTEEEIDYAILHVRESVARLRRISTDEPREKQRGSAAR